MFSSFPFFTFDATIYVSFATFILLFWFCCQCRWFFTKKRWEMCQSKRDTLRPAPPSKTEPWMYEETNKQKEPTTTKQSSFNISACFRCKSACLKNSSWFTFWCSNATYYYFKFQRAREHWEQPSSCVCFSHSVQVNGTLAAAAAPPGCVPAEVKKCQMCQNMVESYSEYTSYTAQSQSGGSDNLHQFL